MFDRILKKIGVKRSFTADLSITQEEFTRQLTKMTAKDAGFLSDLADIFNAGSNKKYRGHIGNEQFNLRIPPSVIGLAHRSEAKGYYQPNGDILKVTVEVSAFLAVFLLGNILIAVVFFLIGLFIVIWGLVAWRLDGLMGAGLFWLFMLLTLLPIRLRKWSVDNLVFDIETDFRKICKVRNLKNN